MSLQTLNVTGLLPKDRGFRPPQEPEYKRIVFCSGKVFYELHAERENLKKENEVAIVRVEQVTSAAVWGFTRQLSIVDDATCIHGLCLCCVV